MDEDFDYEIIIELALSMARITTREKVIQSTWLPFTLLYEVMVKRKEIEPLSFLPREEKLRYWNETTGNKHRRVFVATGVYMYDLLMKYL